jgi:polysaccharide pyruvyl transferase WcaK-like protein
MAESDGEPRRDRLRSAIRDAAQLLVERGYAVEFIGMHWPRDRQEAEAIVSGLPANDRIRVREARDTWSSLVEACASASLVIGMRYHALAAAAMVGRPVIALAYEPKVESLAESLGLLRVSVDDPDIVERLPPLVRDALDRPQSTQAPEGRLTALHAASVQAIKRALG